MTDEMLLELKRKVNKAEAIKQQIDNLKKMYYRRSEINLWGVCIYYDENCEDRQYADISTQYILQFINEFVLMEIKRLEKEFAELSAFSDEKFHISNK